MAPVVLVEDEVKVVEVMETVVEVMETVVVEKEVEVEVKMPCKFEFDSIDNNFL